jgi:hypothetical protein
MNAWVVATGKLPTSTKLISEDDRTFESIAQEQEVKSNAVIGVKSKFTLRKRMQRTWTHEQHGDSA